MKASTMADLSKLTKTQILALTAYGEARGEPIEGIVAVMSVIRNRVNEGRFGGNTYLAVCTKPKQFSCWNEDDPNRKLLEKAVESLEQGILPRVLELCMLLAEGITKSIIPDNTKGANHYLTRKLFNEGTIPWAKGSPKAIIGNHVFLHL